MAALRYAIIGSGMMGQEHIRNIALLGDAEVVAVADPDEGMRTAAARLAGDGCRAFADYRDLLAEGVVEALVIASPNFTHAEVLAAAFDTDLPILVEKPLCTTVADCRRTAERASTRKAPVWVAMEYRYIPAITRLIDRVKAGDIGRLRMFSVREHRYPFLAKVGDWNRFSEKTGGTMVEKCCHFFDLMRLVAGSEPVRIYASGGQDVNHLDETYGGRTPDIIDNAYAIVDFANGVRCLLDLCMFGEGPHFQELLAATGDVAEIEARIPGPARFLPGGKERESEIVFSPRATKAPVSEPVPVALDLVRAGDHHGSTYFQHRRFADMVRVGGRPEVGIDDGYRAVAMGAAAEQSIREKRPILMSELGL